MPTPVYTTDFSSSYKENVFQKIGRLFDALAPQDMFLPKDLVAVKLHFGEAGNMGYIRPQYVRIIVDRLKSLGTKPFLTDTNTLYAGTRIEAYSHLLTAYDNGFTREITGAPLIIADGLRGSNRAMVPVSGKHIAHAHIGADIHNADGLVVLTHFKGHELSGFGGALKNVGMGCASRDGKLEQHSNISPKVNAKHCIGCGHCISRCQGNAIELLEAGERRIARINPERCVGCAECILTCPQGAIKIQWNESIPVFMEKMVEYAAAVLNHKKNKVVFLTFITGVSPLCDCVPFSDVPIIPDVGILASADPVAIDQAAVDLVNRAPVHPYCRHVETLRGADDKFRALYPQVPWEHQLVYAEKLGLGTREYVLVEPGKS